MQDKITGKQVLKIVRQSYGYYMYLENGIIILVQQFSEKIYIIPPKYSGQEITKIIAPNCIEAMKQYMKANNMKKVNQIF